MGESVEHLITIRHPDWLIKAELVVKRVHGMWKSVGMEFPLDEVMQCW